MASALSRIERWFKHLLHLDSIGKLPDPPDSHGSAPVTIPDPFPPAPVPVIAPPSPPVVAAPAPVAAAPAPAANAGAYGLPSVDRLGFYFVPGSEGSPISGYKFTGLDVLGFASLDEVGTDSVNRNDAQNMQNTGPGSVDTIDDFDPAYFTEAVDVTQPKDSNGNFVKLPNCLVYRGPHYDRKPFTVADWPAAIAYWNAHPRKWPKIEHVTATSVAAP